MGNARETITVFLPSLEGGGAERVMVDLANGLVQNAFPVDLVLSSAEGPYLAHVSPDIRIINLAASRVLTSLPGLIRYLRQEQPHVMLSTLCHANLVALWAKRLARVPVRIVIREAATLSKSLQNSPFWAGRAALNLMRYSYRWADRIIAVSGGVERDLSKLLQLPDGLTRVIYNPTVTPELFQMARQPTSHKWFAPDQGPVIVAVGRLTEAKDFPTLIKAFHLVRKEFPAKLVILGEGEQRQELESLINKLNLGHCVDLPGFAANPFSFMARSALFVLSSKFEGLPNALIQAMALGTPVIATDCESGPNEILDGGRYGKLTPVGDVSAMHKAILGILKDEKGCRQETSALRKRANLFSLEKMLPEYLAVLFSDEFVKGWEPPAIAFGPSDKNS